MASKPHPPFGKLRTVRCTACRKAPALLNDDATNKPLCAACWLKKYPTGKYA